MEHLKPCKWTEEETKLLIELAHRKETVPTIARELGRHLASVKRRARELGLPLLPRPQSDMAKPPRLGPVCPGEQTLK